MVGTIKSVPTVLAWGYLGITTCWAKTLTVFHLLPDLTAAATRYTSVPLAGGLSESERFTYVFDSFNPQRGIASFPGFQTPVLDPCAIGVLSNRSCPWCFTKTTK